MSRLFVRQRNRGGAPNDTRFAEHSRTEPSVQEIAPNHALSVAGLIYGMETFPDGCDGTPFQSAWDDHLAALSVTDRREFLDGIAQGDVAPWSVLPPNTVTEQDINNLIGRLADNDDLSERLIRDYAAGSHLMSAADITTGFERYAHRIEFLALRVTCDRYAVSAADLTDQWPAVDSVTIAALINRSGQTDADEQISGLLNYLYSRERLAAERTGMIDRLKALRWARCWPDKASNCPPQKQS